MQPPVVELVEPPGTHELERRHQPQPESGVHAPQFAFPRVQSGGATSAGAPPSPPHWLGR